MFKKLRRRIVLITMLSLLAVFGGTLAVIYGVSYSEVYGKNQDMLEHYAELYYASGSLASQDGGQAARADGARPARIAGGETFSVSSFYAVAFSEDGSVTGVDNDGDTPFTQESLTEFCRALAEKGEGDGVRGNYLYEVSARDGTTLVVLMDNSILGESVTTLFRYTLIFGCGALLLLFLVIWALSGLLVRPLEENDRRQRQFISDAGHELKTPVAVVDANAEMLARETGESKWLSNIRYETDHMGTLIQQLLELERAESAPAAMAACDLGLLAEEEALPFEGVAYEKNVRLDCRCPEGVAVTGNKAQLGRLTAILVDNAIAHSAPEGTVTVTVSPARRGGELSVSNEGAPIPPEERERIFERFYRGDCAREGSGAHYGLGLAIARAIVTAHRGKLGLRCEGGVNTFSVWLPGVR